MELPRKASLGSGAPVLPVWEWVNSPGGGDRDSSAHSRSLASPPDKTARAALQVALSSELVTSVQIPTGEN